MKKLIPALAMLLVAAALMGTSTYAWFSANTQVTASGMSVKAASSGGLAIGSYNYDADSGAITAPAEGDFATSVTIGTGDYVVGNSAIKPVSFNKSHTAGKWFYATASAADSYTAAADMVELMAAAEAAAQKKVEDEGGQYVAATHFTMKEKDAALAEYVNKTTWGVKSLKDGYNVDVIVTDVTVGGVNTSATLDKALRVAFVTSEAAYIFAPVVGSTNLEYVTAINTSAEGVVSFTTADTGIYTGTTAYGGTAQIFTDLTVDQRMVEVYVYYEGQDENCKSANATNIDTLSVTFKLNAINETAN